jgi:hypothetical protein
LMSRGRAFSLRHRVDDGLHARDLLLIHCWRAARSTL